MEYMLLIYSSEADGKKMSAAQHGEIFQGYQTFTQDLTKSGKMKGGAPLEQTTTATTVRVRDSKTLIADGPFAEAKEVVGGFFLLECRTREEAIAIAGECPATEWGTVEVREIGPCYDD